MNICDTLIHIRDTLSPEARSALENEMREIGGVIAPRFNPGQQHLLLVAYDSDAVGASALLDKVRGRGLDASLVAI